METEREMTERWVKEAEFAIKNKLKTLAYIFALIVLIITVIWYFVKY